MKINRKVIGIGVASLGILFSIGGAVALYTQAADPASFNITAGTYAGSTGVVTYKINDAAGASTADPHYCDAEGHNGGLGISPDYPQVKYEFALSAEFANDLPAQTYVMGNINVALTGLNSAFYNKVTVWAGFEGYSEGTVGANSFGTALINDVTIANADTVCAGSRDISVATAGGQKLVVWVKFNLADVDTLGQDELGNLYSLSVSWTKLSSEYAPAYVVGNGNQWTKDDEYAMAVDITSPDYKWVFQGLSGTMAEAKVVCGDTWSSNASNVQLDAEKIYDVDWIAGQEAHFVARS